MARFAVVCQGTILAWERLVLIPKALVVLLPEAIVPLPEH